MHRPGVALVWLVGLLAAGTISAGCYDPRLADCVVACRAAADCAPTHVCGADGWCARPAIAGTCGDLRPGGEDIDASEAGSADAAARDARAWDDAPSPSCAPDCPGACVDGVCVVACAGPGACREEVRCPPGGACRVTCSGARSCRSGVRCGDGPCSVTCSGDRACAGPVVCADACACEVSCTGDEACRAGARCPRPVCAVADGCVASPDGCDAC